ncbi:MAG TPA: hypothetical protein VFR75_09585 [Solirubrobacterales bacterium]|nr:hypothetical protein [Solirubrobacterales bacterium]
MNPVASRLPALLAVALIALLALAGSAQAALSVTPTRTFPMGSLYAQAPDGTFWTTPSGSSNTASFSHFDDEGNNLGDGFSVARNNYFPLGIGAYGGRVYVTASSSGYSQRILSYRIDTEEAGHELLASDEGTGRRMGGNQAMLRIFSDGGGALALGQENKVGTFNAASLVSEHPFYPQAFHGAGINQDFTKQPPFGLESCVVGTGPPAGGEPTPCGTHNGRAGSEASDGVNYPNDIAPGLGGLYISERLSHRISHYNTTANPGATLDLRFGGLGSGAGQLNEPQSIVRQPSTGNLYVSEGGNRRISVFNSGGGFIGAFGYGVLNGADEMQVCGIELGPCQAGVSYLSDPRSYFSRLDFAPNGDLYAYMAVLGQIQVFGVGEGPGTGGGTTGGGGGAGAAPSGPAPAKPEPDKIRIKANPLKVAKGKKTKLTAIVNPPGACQQRLVLFQEKEPRSWHNLGKALKPGKGCTASKLAKVTAKTVYRAVLINGSNDATLGYSPKLTVKLK